MSFVASNSCLYLNGCCCRFGSRAGILMSFVVRSLVSCRVRGMGCSTSTSVCDGSS